MGTPEFAVESLRELVINEVNIVGVITAPDKPKGRGRKLAHSPVKEFALEHNLHILQPTSLKSPEFIEELQALNADLQVVVAFRMLPEVVWNMPPKGTFNLHGSLLPQYRGAAPINWAIMNGEQETGVTTFFLKHEIDTGDIIFQEKEPIHPEDNVGTLYQRLMLKGAKLVHKTVSHIQSGEVHQEKQETDLPLKEAPKIFKETCEIDWNLPAATINNFVRGLSPYPAAWTSYNNKVFKIFEIKVLEDNEHVTPGTLDTDNKTYIRIKCASGAIQIEELQMEGKKRMRTEDLLRGFKFVSNS